MLTQLLCHFLLIFLHKNVRRPAWGPPRGHPKRIPIPIISENLLSIRRRKKLGRNTASLQSNLPAVLVHISSRKLVHSVVLHPFVLHESKVTASRVSQMLLQKRQMCRASSGIGQWKHMQRQGCASDRSTGSLFKDLVVMRTCKTGSVFFFRHWCKHQRLQRRA